MSIKLGLFIQALIMFVLGLYLASQGVPSSETDVIIETGGQIMDTLDDISDSPEVHKIAESTKSSLVLAGFFMTIISIVELIALGVVVFRG